MLSDLRDSGDIEQDVDVALLIWRPKMYWKDEEEWKAVFKKDKYPEDEVEITVAKQRNGPTGFVPMVYDAARVRFMDIERSAK
jgi:replicative DNA helicase